MKLEVFMQITHNSQNSRFRSPLGAAACGESVTLSLFAPGCSGASLRLWQEGIGETMVPMKQSAALFTVSIRLPEKPCILWYYFVINTGGRIVCYGNNPESLGGEGCIYENSQPPSFQITVYHPFQTPEWYTDGLVYQIFPDRFARGSDYEERKKAAALPEGWIGASRSFEENWHQHPSYTRDESGGVADWRFFGGTLEGIREKIPYLRSLGVSALYLNPIFRASSNHRYDTGDYNQVDPLLGTKEDFEHLARDCRKNGIRIILDGVFSHTGADSIYFDRYENYRKLIRPQIKDPKESGAFGHEESKYRSWYRFREEEPGYECWWGVTDLPNVEETNPSYDMFICGPGGVLENWLQAGASGFRLDVADELPDSFIKNIHDTLKEEDPENLLIGEVWEDASNKYSYGELRAYFAGDELDGTMNYPLRDNAIAYCLGEISAELFCRKMRSLQENYPKPAFYSSLNLIGGHDCERILSVLGGYRKTEEDLLLEDGTFLQNGSALSLDSSQLALAKERLKMLSALQYVMPGVPCIYYGDEAGIQGSKDPDNRRTFPWGKEDPDLLYHYRMLGLLYHSHCALKDGDFEISERDGCLFVIRSNKNEVILTVINPTGEQKTFSEPFKTLFSSQYRNRRFVYGLELLTSEEVCITETSLEFQAEPVSARIILLKEEAPEKPGLSKAAGILCHLSSLPGRTEDPSFPSFAGALGRRGRDFVDWLSDSGFRLWQILPVNPVGAGNSPYFSPCVFAGETRFIDPEELPDRSGFEEFCGENSYWLSDWAEYAKAHGIKPVCIPDGKNPEEISAEETAKALMYDQYVFFSQLKALKSYANSRGILLIGDLPIYAAPDSADLKAHPECFQLDEKGHPLNVGGVPPDYFSETGQYWSNPLYNWAAMEKNGYEWWVQRLRLALNCYDYIRLDHFRSFSEYFSIPAGRPPKEGFWQKGPGMKFFSCLKEQLGRLPIIAEDLGQLDAGVFNLMKLTGFPGMNVWQFSAEEMQEMKKDQIGNRIFYSGTHDNQTLAGWCACEYPDEDASEKAQKIMQELMESDAPWVLFQLQDVLLLGDEARMNVPGTVDNNWVWSCREPLPKTDFSRNS